MNHQTHNYMVKLFKILSNSNRLRTLNLLADSKGPLTVNVIADSIGIDQSTLSGHLTRMRENGVVKAKQQGAHMYYSLKDPNVAMLLRSIK